MTHADQLRDLADVVEAVEAGPAALLESDLRHDDQGDAVAELTVEVPLPLDGIGQDTPTDQQADVVDEDESNSISVTELTEVATGLGESITTRLEDAGYETIADIEAATPDELEGVPQLGPTTVEQVLDAAAEVREEAPPTEDPEPPRWTPDSNTGGVIVPTRRGQKKGETA